MKKLLAVVLALALVLSFSVTAFALKSPGGTVYHEVIINRTNDGESSETAERVTVKENGELELQPEKSDDGKFEGWKFFTPEMKPAVEGTDYEIVKVTKEDGSKATEGVDYEIKDGEVVSKKGELINVVIKPIAETVYVSEAYAGVDIEFNVPDGTVNSPVTADIAVAVVAFVMAIAAGAVMLLTSKRAHN